MVVLQSVAVGENLVKLKYTRASAVKEKEGKLVCQADVLCEGESSLTSIYYHFISLLEQKLCFHFSQVLNYPESIMTSTARSTSLSMGTSWRNPL